MEKAKIGSNFTMNRAGRHLLRGAKSHYSYEAGSTMEETTLEIVRLGDDILRTKCREVSVFDDAFRLLASAMLETLSQADGVGLAAPQIGVDGRFFVVDIRDGRQYVFVNPEILEMSEETGLYDEGCLSIPGVYHNVTRPLRVRVHALDEYGKAFTLDADGLLARVIQHENDHLDGHLFIDHLSEEERQKVLRAYEKKSRSAKGRKKRK